LTEKLPYKSAIATRRPLAQMIRSETFGDRLFFALTIKRRRVNATGRS
jgi:hypothetical protein